MTQNNSYLESFKLMVVEKYMSGMTKAQIMRQFGISSSTLYMTTNYMKIWSTAFRSWMSRLFPTKQDIKRTAESQTQYYQKH